ncbi:MAG: ABC transporter ATP-binding protein [Spirochaetaceae bacterium]|jgi:iron complex transport system ATP-binding protein|nr:ABC transporter ATP-binding protein [Spirochaetaceae bacterium]
MNNMENKTKSGEKLKSIRVENVCFAYPGMKIVLENISFEAAEGEHISIVGPNGSGKSTLFQILAGFLTPASGRVLLGGGNIAGMSPSERARRLSFVPQDINADFPFSCLELVLMALYPHRPRLMFTGEADIELARTLMIETGVWRFAEKNIMSLSGGERQRVIITRALLQVEGASSGGEGSILLLDEAMSALDIAARIDMMKLLSQHASRGRFTVLGIHHDLYTAYRFSSRVIALNHGVIAASGNPRQVFTSSFFQDVFSVKAEILGEKGFVVHDSVPVSGAASRFPAPPLV